MRSAGKHGQATNVKPDQIEIRVSMVSKPAVWVVGPYELERKKLATVRHQRETRGVGSWTI